jgi:hypothetical protein
VGAKIVVLIKVENTIVFPRDEGENVRAGLVNKYKITVGLG